MLSELRPWTTCRVCGGSELTELFSLGGHKVNAFPGPDDPPPVSVPITLDLCRNPRCHLVQQRWTAPQELLYSRTYWYRSGVTDTMREALRDVVRSIETLEFPVFNPDDPEHPVTTKFVLNPDDVVLDIGANDGTLLRSWELPCIRVGCEPAANMRERLKGACEAVISDFWSAEKYRSLLLAPPRVVTAIGMFYDLDDPNRFIRDVAAVLAPDGVFVAQLMCLKQTLQRCDLGNLCHEHLEFYTLRSLDLLFNTHGLEIFRVEQNDVNGGSYRLYARRLPDGDRPMEAAPLEHNVFGRDGEFDVQIMEDWFRAQLTERLKLLRFMTDNQDKRFWVYGASTKGNTVLQFLGLNQKSRVRFEAAADRSPEKHGRMTVTGVPIVSEQAFREARPDFALVLPYAFLPEFVEREKEWLAAGGRFLTFTPTFKVVEP